MTNFIRRHIKKTLIIPPIVVGSVILALVIQSGTSDPRHNEAREEATAVRVIQVPLLTLMPRALAYGNVKPGKTWKAVANVGGKVVDIHPQLQIGALIAEGDILVKIDPTEYRLTADQARANIAKIEAQLSELLAKKENARLSLEIEKRSLALSQKELERKRRLMKTSNASQSSVDREERNVLARRQSMQVQINALNLFPSERKILQSERSLLKARLAIANRNLEHTTIRAPFDGRVAVLNIEKTQYAAPGTTLAAMDSIDIAEVAAQISAEKLINLMSPGIAARDQAGRLMDALPNITGLEALVRLRSGNLDIQWPARFVRVIDSVDPQTRTVGVVVAVDEPYRTAVPGKRPPLVKNMYVEVELRGKPRPNVIVVPRSAVFDNRVYIVTKDNRLAFRDVEIAYHQGDVTIIRAGLEGGETIVVSDPLPAIEGMLLVPKIDKAIAARLLSVASGEGPVR